MRWDPAKNEKLKRERGASFEEILLLGVQVASIENPTRGDQKAFLIENDGMIWFVPYVQDGEDVFLKTAYPSRKYTRWWKGKLQ